MKQRIIDQVEFKVKAGTGGGGIISFRREKYIPKGGPDGGDGGNGGSIYVVANPHMTTLMDYAGKDRFQAEHGGGGKPRRQHGKDADDVILEVPVGTVIWEKTREDGFVKLADLDTAGAKALVAKGGAGGKGNDYFKSSINTTPMQSEQGEKGEEKYLKLELKILADVGLVGLPNAGKSTLLSVLTSARPEIANYPFTTITPNLGVMEGVSSSNSDSAVLTSVSNEVPDAAHNSMTSTGAKRQLIIADIPGLIEDAHKGKGLGVDFLRHIERCRVLVYVISPTEEDLGQLEDKQKITASLREQYELVRREVTGYGKGVDEKQSMVVLNKTDVLPADIVENVTSCWKEQKEKIIPVSAVTGYGLDELKDQLKNCF